MKSPLRYQFSEYDCGPTTMLNAVSYLIEREEIPPEIIRNVKKDGDAWAGGTILDSAKGKVYKVKMTPIEAGKKLEVRGYVGAPMFGRTQTWHRVE